MSHLHQADRFPNADRSHGSTGSAPAAARPVPAWAPQRSTGLGGTGQATAQTVWALDPDGAAALDMLDVLGTGLLHLDHLGRVLYANAAAQQALRAHDGLGTAEGVLQGTVLNPATTLTAVLEGAAGRLSNLGTALQLSRNSGAEPYRAVIVPFPRAAPGQEPTVLLMLHDPGAPDFGLHRRLRGMFGLSDSEAAIAVGLADGATLDELATRRGVKVSTVRSQMRSLLRKTATSRQSELVRIVTSLPTVRLPSW